MGSLLVVKRLDEGEKKQTGKRTDARVFEEERKRKRKREEGGGRLFNPEGTYPRPGVIAEFSLDF